MFSSIKISLIEGSIKEVDTYFSKGAPNPANNDELVQLTAATIGFLSEMRHSRKEQRIKSEAKKVEEAAMDGIDLNSEGSASETFPISTALAATFPHRHSKPVSAPLYPISVWVPPILIPQRRPNSRGRGFQLAYAPVLSTFNISQPAFLDFITTLNKSLKPSAYLNAISLASFVGEASLEPLIGLLVGETVAAVTNATMEA